MFWLKMIAFSRNRVRTEHEVLAKVDDNSSKTHRIRSKLDSLDSIRFTPQAHATKNMHPSLKYHVL